MGGLGETHEAALIPCKMLFGNLVKRLSSGAHEEVVARSQGGMTC